MNILKPTAPTSLILSTFAITLAIGMSAFAGSAPPPKTHSQTLPPEEAFMVPPELCAGRATMIMELNGKRQEGIAEAKLINDFTEFLRSVDESFDSEVNDTAAVTDAIHWLYQQPIGATGHQVGQAWYDACVERFETAQRQKEI